MFASAVMTPRLSFLMRHQAVITCQRLFSSMPSASKAPARVVVVGSGRMGNIRASIVNANPRFELCGIVDSNPAAALALANTYRVASYDDLQTAIDMIGMEGKVNGIIACSPTFTHEAVVRTACSNGIDIFTEKPVDETADKINHLFQVAASAGINLCCGFQRRFDPSYKAACDSIKEGAIGKPVMANIFFADHPLPSKEFLLTGGNIFMDLSAHDIDFITHCLDDEVVSVYASGSSSDKELENAGVHDNATIVMNFKKGAVVTLFMSRFASYGYDQRVEIFGSNGLVSVGNVHENTMVISNIAGSSCSRLQNSFPERFKEAFTLEMDAFADTLLLNEPWPVTGEQCVKVQRVADAARHSCDVAGVVNMSSYPSERLAV